jgi:hypothetical protein
MLSERAIDLQTFEKKRETVVLHLLEKKNNNKIKNTKIVEVS